GGAGGAVRAGRRGGPREGAAGGGGGGGGRRRGPGGWRRGGAPPPPPRGAPAAPRTGAAPPPGGPPPRRSRRSERSSPGGRWREAPRGEDLATGERRRGHRVDLHADQLARRRRTLEVHRLVVPVAPAKAARIRAARPLDEHLAGAADEALGPLARAALDELDEPLHALPLHIVGNLAGERSRLGAAPRRVDERERAVESN